MPERRERPSQRHLLIAVVGPPGSGKSTIVKALAEEAGANRFIEEYKKVRNLRKFYLEDSARYAYGVQRQFLNIRGRQQPQVREQLQNGPLVLDSCLLGDATIEGALHRRRLITDKNHFKYLAKKRQIEHDPNYLEPDFLIFSRIKKSTMDRWIIQRNRRMEIEKIEKEPGYFDFLADAFDVAFEEIILSRKGVIPIEIAKYDIVQSELDRRMLVRECCNWIGYYLGSGHARGLGGIGSDGAKLIIPDFLKPPARDYSQESWESSRLRGT